MTSFVLVLVFWGDTISNMSIAREFPEKMSSIKILKFFPPAIEDIRGFVVK